MVPGVLGNSTYMGSPLSLAASNHISVGIGTFMEHTMTLGSFEKKDS